MRRRPASRIRGTWATAKVSRRFQVLPQPPGRTASNPTTAPMRGRVRVRNTGARRLQRNRQRTASSGSRCRACLRNHETAGLDVLANEFHGRVKRGSRTEDRGNALRFEEFDVLLRDGAAEDDEDVRGSALLQHRRDPGHDSVVSAGKNAEAYAV